MPGKALHAVTVLAVFAALSAFIVTAEAAQFGTASAPQTAANRGVVELETGRGSGISVGVAEDLANVLDDGATRRVLPVVGKGGLGNITDLELLHGIDLAILQDDVMNYARQQNLFPGIEYRMTYIAKLYNEEFHLLARDDIKTIADLANRKVNVDLRGGGTGITASRLFGLLNIPIVTTNDDSGVALDKLRRGEIAALAIVTGRPAPIFQGLIGENHLHFLAIPLNPAVTAAYMPARLTAEDYPALIPYNHPVDTVAVGAVLVVANLQPQSDRYRNVVNFVDAFFTNFQSLLMPGHNPKWHEVNIAAELPGWRRFPPAADWLQRNAPSGGEPGEQALKAIFARFIDERQQAAGGAPLSPQQKVDLFNQFEEWQKSQVH
ncbi:MAG TPA: TAXI family TRAP transporter solute-binding subunit [Stellaceae bacterium]|nr:TAXI family TRAP transporter solute-binding subunit [Stellaceae bacterium]